MKESEKYIQIMPADNWWVSYRNDDGSTLYSKIAIFALKNNGDIDYLDMDGDGVLECPDHVENFIKFFYSPKNMLELNKQELKRENKEESCNE